MRFYLNFRQYELFKLLKPQDIEINKRFKEELDSIKDRRRFLSFYRIPLLFLSGFSENI